MATIYYRYANGAIGVKTTSGDDAGTPPDGAAVITQAEYEQDSAAIVAGYTQLDEQREAEQQADAHDDYDALLAAGIPEATAQRLSGYQPGDSPGEVN